MYDFLMNNEGTICILSPITEQAKKWVNEHIVDALTWGDGIVIEHRYIDGILIGLQADGLTVH